jgi:hypothetical protein
VEDHNLWCRRNEEKSREENKRQEDFDGIESVAHCVIDFGSGGSIEIMKRKQNDLRDFLYLFVYGGTMAFAIWSMIKTGIYLLS